MPDRTPLTRFISRLLLLPILAAGLYFASCSLLSQIYFSMARAGLVSMESGVRASLQKQEVTARYLEKSKALQSANPAVHELQGDYYWHKRRLNTESEPQLLSLALDHYRKSAALMPTRADHWLKIAYAKTALGQIDEEFSQAYRTAFDYGGWEYQIVHGLTQIGFAYWYNMGLEHRLVLKESYLRLYTVNKKEAFGIAKNYGQLRLACIWQLDQSEPDALCEKELSDDR